MTTEASGTTFSRLWTRAVSVGRSKGLPAVARGLFRYVRSRASKYKSQKGQDRWVLESLRYKKQGYFVDLAASDGITDSNTWVLEKWWQWNGVVVEPNPYFFPEMAARRNVAAYRCAVDETAGTVSFRIDNGGLGGIVADDTDNSPAVRGEQLRSAEVVDIPARTLTDLLHEANAPRIIDYLSLDVEGAEERVLRGLDLSKYTFYCMTIERPNEAVSELLLNNGYLFVKNDRFDAFYIHESHPFADSIARDPFESIPAKDW